MSKADSPKILFVANVAKEHIVKFHIPTIKMLKEHGWRVDVACKADADIPYCDNVFNLPTERSPFHLKTISAIRKLRELIRKGQYEIIYCHTVTGGLVARMAARPLRKSGIKVVYLSHGFYFYRGAPIKKWLMGYPMEWLLSTYTDEIITINHEDYEFAKKRLNAPIVKMIDGIGVNLDKFSVDFPPNQKMAYRESLGFSDKDYIAIYVAELTKLKNQTSLIDAAKILVKKIPEFKLLLVGPDHMNGKLQRRAEKLPDKCVVFTGWRNDVCQLLHMSDIALASSSSEGLGLNIVEAMACGLPVVAYDNRGHREIISDRKNGRLVPFNDVNKLADAVVEIHDDRDLADKWKKNAMESIKRFDGSNVLADIYEILNQILDSES